MQKVCEQCKASFKVKKRTKANRFCRLQCYWTSKVGKPAPTLGYKYPFKERPWQKGTRTGPNNGKWIADRTKLKVGRTQAYDNRYRDWMKAVKNRDGWQCRIANRSCSGRLEAHHILPWRSHAELRYEINNGITLCQYHHPHKREDEFKLSPYFKSLVESTQL